MTGFVSASAGCARASPGTVSRGAVALIDGPVSQWPGSIIDPGTGRRESDPVGATQPPQSTQPTQAAVHAQAMADAMSAAGACDDRELLNVRIFDAGLRTNVKTLNDAMDSLLAWPGTVDLVLCAFGLARADSGLIGRLDSLVQKAGIVVASAPARGARVWPAAHPGVLAVQGDARCGPGQWSALALEHADFGAAPGPTRPGGPAGASMAAARFAGLLLANTTARGRPAIVLAMTASSHFQGRERRNRGPFARG